MNIADASSLTRATSGDSDFEYGKDEHNVTDADFYFYDENGVFVTQAKAWNDGKDNEAEPDENIEYFGNSIIVLKGLSQKGFPKYLVTVCSTPPPDSNPGTPWRRCRRSCREASKPPERTSS